MAAITGVGNLELFRHLWRYEFERVASHINVRDRLFNLRHMARNALRAGAPCSMMRVRFDGRCVGTVGRTRTVAHETDLVRGLDQVGIISGAVDIMAAETRDAPPVHEALNEVIALHSILVRGPVGKVREGRLSQFVLLQLPEIAQITALMEPDRPVVIAAFDGIL